MDGLKKILGKRKRPTIKETKELELLALEAAKLIKEVDDKGILTIELDKRFEPVIDTISQYCTVTYIDAKYMLKWEPNYERILKDWIIEEYNDCWSLFQKANNEGVEYFYREYATVPVPYTYFKEFLDMDTCICGDECF